VCAARGIFVVLTTLIVMSILLAGAFRLINGH
jgi:hypothetical protein